MDFNPARLILARKRRGLSRVELVRRAQQKSRNISERSISYYESGEVEPSSDAVETLAELLDFPVAFFFGRELEEIAYDAASFRSLSTMTASQRYSAVAIGTLALALYQWIEDRFELPEPNVPSLREFEPETAAEVLRDEWGLGTRPIKNVVHLLEVHGVRICSLPIDSASVDAFSVRQGKTPFIFLSSMKSAERSRMDAAHELAHLTLHSGHGIPRGRQAEHEADVFASAFLMPAADVKAHIPRAMSIEAIHRLKRRWNVSAIALVHRAKTLDLITEWQYRSYCIELAKQGYRKSEKDGTARDTSQVLGKVFDALRAEGISRHKIAGDLLVSSSELDSLLVGLVIASVPSTQTTSINNGKTEQKKPPLKLV